LNNPQIAVILSSIGLLILMSVTFGVYYLSQQVFAQNMTMLSSEAIAGLGTDPRLMEEDNATNQSGGE
jgi:hypothetical protein